MAKVRVTDLAKQMGIPDKDLLFKLQSLGVQVESATAAIDHEIIMAILSGKKLATRPRNVIMRDEKPVADQKKAVVKPPRPIVKSSPKKEEPAPAPEAAAAPATPAPIIPEFVKAVEAEAEEEARAAKAPKAPAKPKKAVAEPAPVTAEAAPEAAPSAPSAPPAVVPVAPVSPAPPAAVHPPAAASTPSPRPTGPTGPRARMVPAPRPNYQGQTPRPVYPPTPPRPSYPPSAGPGQQARGGPPPRATGGGYGAPAGPGAGRPMGGEGYQNRPRPSGPGGGFQSRPGGSPGGFRPGGAGGPSRGPGGPGRGPGSMPAAPPVPGPNAITRRKKTEHEEERPEKKKSTGKRGKRTSGVEDDSGLFTKGPFSATAALNDDEPLAQGTRRATEHEDAEGHTPSNRRDARKQASPVSARILQFTRPEGKVTLSEGVTVKELADKVGVKANDLMKHLLMKKGLMVSINAPLGAELALQIAKELEIDAELVSFEAALEIESMEKYASAAEGSRTEPRAPVITVMGHVDHGKTSLLDVIRETKVAAGEAGGITQHIGAYQVEKRGRKIVFLDTPGHEAFTMMRARGAKVTDIVVLVVAADDGVMPQTKEAIDHARAAKVPMVVAINKIDKPNANLDRVRKELSGAGVLVEQWGGDVVSVEVSALKKQGIDELLDMILLTADLLDLKASKDSAARGIVIEARKDVGRGIVSTVLIQDGTLRVGDAFFSGSTHGRVRAMTDEHGTRLKEVGPSTPVIITGFDDVPNAGDPMQVVDDEAQARVIGGMRQEKRRDSQIQKATRMSLEQLFQKMQTGAAKEINIIVKADVQGSVEVLTDTLRKLSNEQVKVNVLHASVGAVSTNDILLASASDAIVVGFGVRPERSATELAEKEGVDIRLHTVIYHLTDEIRQAMTGVLDPKLQEVFQGRAEVRNTFKVPKIGTIAGCYVNEGVIARSAGIRLLRDNRVIFEGKIGSLRHFKNDVTEVKQGFECGIGIERFQDVKNGDVIEAYKIEKIAGVLQ